MKSFVKQVMLFVSAILVSTSSLAAPSTGLSKNSSQLKALGSAWKAYHSIQPSLNKNDIEMGYGGQDVSHAPTLALASNIA